MTETCSHVALRPFGDSRYHALPGVEFSLAEGIGSSSLGWEQHGVLWLQTILLI